MKHRGRIQAQGKKLEESEAWAQNEPPTIEEGLDMVENLKSKLSKKDLEIRKDAFEKLEKIIVNAANTNGIEAPSNVTINVKGHRKERVDIEVKKGKAFIKGEQ